MNDHTQTHHVLEQQLAERTAELEAANKELDAFSHSVAHDLRAPLRAIDGFSEILLSEYAGSLPADAQEYLRDILSSARRMGMMVDELLALSRLNRQPVKQQSVDCDQLVRDCLVELNGEFAGRPVEWQIASLPPCQADPALLKQVWLNLISNAIKYTARRDPAVIEVGSQPGENSPRQTYFVRDNGVGFDMRYAHKLFGVFQRLHRAEDFPGTGVGLATVQRIVHRHGGSVWAEGQPDVGATFYFSLPAGEVRP